MKAGVIIPWEKIQNTINTSILKQFLTKEDDYVLCFVVPSIKKDIPVELKTFMDDKATKSKINIIYRAEEESASAFTKGVRFFSNKRDINFICILEEFSFDNIQELEEQLQHTYKTKNLASNSRFSIKQLLFKFSMNLFL